MAISRIAIFAQTIISSNQRLFKIKMYSINQKGSYFYSNGWYKKLNVQKRKMYLNFLR